VLAGRSPSPTISSFALRRRWRRQADAPLIGANAVRTSSSAPSGVLCPGETTGVNAKPQSANQPSVDVTQTGVMIAYYVREVHQPKNEPNRIRRISVVSLEVKRDVRGANRSLLSKVFRATKQPRGKEFAMLSSLRALEQYTVSAIDGDVGHVVNFLLDDDGWAIRYLVVMTNGLIDGDQVLISPISFRRVDWVGQRVELALTKDEVRASPSVDVDKPVSRQHEWAYYRYYQYPHYWEHPEIWGRGAHPELLANAGSQGTTAMQPADVHLHSATAVRGYHIQGTDGDIGHLEDFIVDDETWEVRYLAVNTSNWWIGKKVMIAPHWTNRVSCEENTVYINMTRKAIRDCPERSAIEPINCEH
jgi:hypothetical protein